MAWDLQESDALHSLVIPWKNGEVTLRNPTYDSGKYGTYSLWAPARGLSLTVCSHGQYGSFQHSCAKMAKTRRVQSLQLRRSTRLGEPLTIFVLPLQNRKKWRVSCRKTSSTPAAATLDSYQLISLHSDGTIRIWTALMTLSREPSELDLGLMPGGRLKLVQSTTLKPPVAALRNICG